MISQLFVLAPNGHTIVHKDYRGDVPKDAPEIFLRRMVDKTDTPVFQVDGVNYICVRKNGLFFMCTTVYNVSPAFVIELLRLSRSYVANSNGLNLKENFMPRQTYSHVILSCFSCVLKIMAQRRLNPKLPVCLYKIGSNCCEENFSELGGFGRIAGFKRNYTAGDAIEGIGDVNTLNLYGA